MSPERRALRDAAIAWGVVAVLVTGLVQIRVTITAIGDLGSALIAVAFLYVPVVVASRRKEDLDHYGFHAAPVGRGLAIAGVSAAVIFPIFVACFYAFYEIACNSELLGHLVPHQLCGGYRGLGAIHPPALNAALFEFCAVQWIAVALPEELFFRGMLLKLLEQRFPPRRRILGGGVGLALVLQAAAFALIHLPKDGDPRALVVFFPGLLFGWMRSATGSILASTLVHGASNILIRLLELSIFA